MEDRRCDGAHVLGASAPLVLCPEEGQDTETSGSPSHGCRQAPESPTRDEGCSASLHLLLGVESSHLRLSQMCC